MKCLKKILKHDNTTIDFFPLIKTVKNNYTTIDFFLQIISS